MYKQIIIILICYFLGFSLLYSKSLQNENNKTINHLPCEYINIQYAGYIGFLSVGCGNTFLNGKYGMEIYNGITPNIGGISQLTIHSFGIKNNYIPYTLNTKYYSFRPYAGIGIIASTNYRYDPNWQDNIKDDYYYQKLWYLSIHTGLFIDKKIKNHTISSVGIYLEAVALDTFLQNYFSNDSEVTLKDTFTLALGIKIGF